MDARDGNGLVLSSPPGSFDEPIPTQTLNLSPRVDVKGAEAAAPQESGSSLVPRLAAACVVPTAPVPIENDEESESSLRSSSSEPSYADDGASTSSASDSQPGLPSFLQVSVDDQEDLLRRKILCCFSLTGFHQGRKHERDTKRKTLFELISFFGTPAGQRLFSKLELQSITMEMIGIHVIRTLPPPRRSQALLEASRESEIPWPHLQAVYKLFFTIVCSKKLLQVSYPGLVSKKMCKSLIHLFGSEHRLEREYLRFLVHRVYRNFPCHRVTLKRAISDVFLSVVHEGTEPHKGIGDLLVLYGCIIRGYATPMRPQNVVALEHVLIPLHRCTDIERFHDDLVECMIEYCEKDNAMTVIILKQLMRLWPWKDSTKQLLFLDEFEVLLELLTKDQLEETKDDFFRFFPRLLELENYQILEKTLCFWKNISLVDSGYLGMAYAPELLPLVYGPLDKHSQFHWHCDVANLATYVLAIYELLQRHVFVGCREREEIAGKTRTNRQKQVAQSYANVEVLADLNLSLKRELPN